MYLGCRFQAIVFALAFVIPGAAFAEEATTTTVDASKATISTSVGDVLKAKKFEENTQITDAKLRADAGSLSRYSAKFNLSYYGPTLDDLSKREQPNPDGGIGVYQTALSGSIGVRYRIDKQQTLGFGTGLKALTPLHGVQRTDVNDPYFSYDYTTKLGEVQTRSSAGLSYITTPNYRDVGEILGLNWDESMVYRLGLSPVSLSFDTSVGYYVYERELNPKMKNERKSTRYAVSFYPGLKYFVNDKLSFTTSLAFSFANPRIEGESVLQRKTLSQRLGLGWAVVRDVYISPYVNFYPQNLAIDTTTINFSTVFSIL